MALKEIIKKLELKIVILLSNTISSSAVSKRAWLAASVSVRCERCLIRQNIRVRVR